MDEFKKNLSKSLILVLDEIKTFKILVGLLNKSNGTASPLSLTQINQQACVNKSKKSIFFTQYRVVSLLFIRAKIIYFINLSNLNFRKDDQYT